jgi:uncharacterized membrane protein
MSWGLIAALCWGIADISAAICGRRIGSQLTVGLAQATSLVLLIVFGAAAGEAFHVRLDQSIPLIVDGFAAAAAYLALYKALELGPVALVSPIVAAYTAITVVLAVLLLHESIHGILLLGIVTTLAGVVLASTSLEALRRSGLRLDSGVRLAVVAMVLFGFATFVVGYYAKQTGWFPASFYARVGNCLGVGLFLALFARSEIVTSRPGRGAVALAAGIGLADVLGLVAYAKGTSTGMVSLVSAVSSAFILIPVLGGLLLFRERPARSQLLGVALVGVGLVLLGLS